MSDWTLAGVTLPGDLLWQDEFRWSSVRQVYTPTLQGGLIIEQSQMQTGRPITLVSQTLDKFVATVTRATLDELRALDVTPRSAMTLTSPDSPARTFSVVFRHADGAAIEAAPIDFAVPAADDDLFLLTLRLIQV